MWYSNHEMSPPQRISWPLFYFFQDRSLYSWQTGTFPYVFMGQKYAGFTSTAWVNEKRFLSAVFYIFKIMISISRSQHSICDLDDKFKQLLSFANSWKFSKNINFSSNRAQSSSLGNTVIKAPTLSWQVFIVLDSRYVEEQVHIAHIVDLVVFSKLVFSEKSHFEVHFS